MATHKNLAAQAIVITGASSRVGLCTAFLAAEEGGRDVRVDGMAVMNSILSKIMPR